MALDLEWTRTLKHRRGARTRLDGMDVYYDFNWAAVVGHNTSQFTNGQCLAKRVREACPAGKTPALLLTDDEEAKEGYVETPLHLVFVLNLPAYLAADADASRSYLASRLGEGITRLGPLGDLTAARADDVRAILDAESDLARIAAAASANPELIARLRAIPGVATPGIEEASLPEIISALEALAEGLDADSVAMIGRLFGPGADRERRLELLRAITDDPDGRYVTGEVVAERTTERIADARAAIAEYQAMLDNPAATETELQRFIEGHPWLLGLEYVRVRPRRDIPRGTADFILERFDGFHDLLELKSPADEIIRAPDPVDGVQPSASDYRLSPALAQALAQVHVYRDVLTRDAGTMLRLYGLDRTRDPRVIIVVGRAPPTHRADVLRELNKSLHRMEIVPYDALAERGEAVLDNVVRYLLAAGEPTEATAA